MVYQIVYHEYDKNVYLYCSNYVGNQFIIAKRHLGCLWYRSNIPRLRAVPKNSKAILKTHTVDPKPRSRCKHATHGKEGVVMK